MTFSISDLYPTEQDSIILHGHVEVTITHNVTGFGQRRYFICPSCNRQCAKLHYLYRDWFCHVCIPQRQYAKRQNMYRRGRNLIKWHMDRLLTKNGLRDLKQRPKHMNKQKYDEIVTQYGRLFELLNFSIFFNYRPTAKSIKAIATGAELIDIRQYTKRRIFREWR